MQKQQLKISLFTLLLFILPGYIGAQDNRESPLTITLESSGVGQQIAAGSTRVPMARFKLEAAEGGTFSLDRLALIFTGDTLGIGRCELHKAPIALKDKKSLIASIKTPATSGPVTVVLNDALLLTRQENLELLLVCDIADGAVGRAYSWGISNTPELAKHTGTTLQPEFIAPDIRIAPTPDHRKPGRNGATFTVVKPDTVLDEAYLEPIVIKETEKQVAAGTPLTAMVTLVNKNPRGGTAWLPEDHKLVPSLQSSSVELWSNTDSYTLAEPVPPGGSVTFMIPLTAPAVTGIHRLGWHLISSNPASILIQNQQTLRLGVLSPEPAPQAPKNILESISSLIKGPTPLAVKVPADTVGAPVVQTVTESSFAETTISGNVEQKIVSVQKSMEPSQEATKEVEMKLEIKVSPPEPVLTPALSIKPREEVVRSPLSLPGAENVLDPISAAKKILENLLNVVDVSEIDYPSLKSSAKIFATQFSGLSLYDKNHTLSQSPIILTFPGGSFSMKFVENSFPTDFRMEADIKDLTEISQILAEHPLPIGYEVIGHVLVGEFDIEPIDSTTRPLLVHPITTQVTFEDPALSGWDWDRETIGIYNLSATSTWQKVPANTVLLYSKNMITVSAQPNINDLGVIALLGKKLPPPKVDSETNSGYRGASIWQPKQLASVVCSTFELFGWPRPITCG